MRVDNVLSILKSYLINRLIEDRNGTYERDILTPNTYSRKAYESQKYGFTRMDKAAFFLGMGKKAFDLMVAAHSDIFRRIGIYDDKKWYLPDLYLKEIRENEGFYLIKGKYELLAKEGRNSLRSSGGAGEKIHTSNRRGSQRKVIQNYQDFRKSAKNAKGRESLVFKDNFIKFLQIAVDPNYTLHQRATDDYIIRFPREGLTVKEGSMSFMFHGFRPPAE